MPEIKERPILFSWPMVRTILDGRKTVTRRAIKKPPADGWAFDGEYGRITSPHPRRGRFGAFIRRGVGTDFPELDIIPSPCGQPGDRLWVRETLHYDCEQGHYYAAGGKHGETVYLRSLFDDDAAQTGCSYDGLLPERSVPSIHLHRRYSRILLEVTDIRVERLQDITAEQAVAEGIQRAWQYADTYLTPDGNFADAKVAFQRLWESINGPESWDANPWVWRIEFKRIQP